MMKGLVSEFLPCYEFQLGYIIQSIQSIPIYISFLQQLQDKQLVFNSHGAATMYILNN